jgi:large subunit ribosomal protein L6
MRAIETVTTVEIPENVQGTLECRVVTLKGEKGQLVRDFSHAAVIMSLEDKTFTIKANWPRKKEIALVGTVSSHIKNMIKGVTTGFTYKLKIVFSHFPLTGEIKSNMLTIKNFTGERSPRAVKIPSDVKVTIKGEDIIVQGIDLEHVSQTAANIQNATKIKRKDPRVFLDGIYVFEEHEGFVE